MERKYLTSPMACKLYEVKIKIDEVRPGSDWTSCFVIKDEGEAKKVIGEIRSTFEKFKNKCKWTGDKRYFYVTTGYASHFKKMHVTKGRIKTKKAAEYYQPCNYFETKADAEELLLELKNVFRQFNFVFEEEK